MEAILTTNYEGFSMVKQIALKLLDNIRSRIMSDDCSDEQITEVLVTFHPERHGYFKQEDFVTADVAMKMLHLGYNRVKFFELTKEFGIENHKISNQNVGFLRKDIERLACILHEEVKDRELKEKKKKGQRKVLW